MKTTTLRWSCRFVRTWKSLAGDATNIGLGSGHIAKCPDCQRYFAAADQLTSALRRDAVAERHAAPAGFDLRVLQAIHHEAAPRRRERHVGRLAFAVAGVAAAVVLALVPLRQPPRQTASVVAVNSAALAPQLDAAMNALPALDASVASVLKKEPLQQEVQSVYADARSAVRFLALNFLPDGATTQPATDRGAMSGG